MSIVESVNENGNTVYTITNEIVKQVLEDEEKFIIETISPYLTQCYKQVIPKQLLIRALTTFQIEHKDEWEHLMAKASKSIREDMENDNGNI